MKMFKYIVVGFFFGFGMWKLEAISTFRIIEMFHFQSFHMYGVIGSAVAFGVLTIWFIKKTRLKDNSGNYITVSTQEPGYPRNLIGGIIFGLGWAITGACPGPLFILAGHQGWVFLIPIASAILGTFTYGVVRNKLPH